MPVLWDKKENTIVNNESADIVRMFNSAFNELATKPELDLCALLVLHVCILPLHRKKRE